MSRNEVSTFELDAGTLHLPIYVWLDLRLADGTREPFVGLMFWLPNPCSRSLRFDPPFRHLRRRASSEFASGQTGTYQFLGFLVRGLPNRAAVSGAAIRERLAGLPRLIRTFLSFIILD